MKMTNCRSTYNRDLRSRMKILVVQFLFALALSLFSFADLVVPETVADTFRQKYPNAPEPTWEVDTNGSYEANYKINGVKYRADFTKEGIWTETENNIDFICRDYYSSTSLSNQFAENCMT